MTQFILSRRNCNIMDVECDLLRQTIGSTQLVSFALVYMNCLILAVVEYIMHA